MADLAKILRDMPPAQREALAERMRGNEPTMSKYEARYMEQAPPGEGMCRDCSRYRESDGTWRCTLVRGIINPDGHCDHFAPREEPMAGMAEDGMGGPSGAMPPGMGGGMY